MSGLRNGLDSLSLLSPTGRKTGMLVKAAAEKKKSVRKRTLVKDQAVRSVASEGSGGGWKACSGRTGEPGGSVCQQEAQPPLPPRCPSPSTLSILVVGLNPRCPGAYLLLTTRARPSSRMHPSQARARAGHVTVWWRRSARLAPPGGAAEEPQAAYSEQKRHWFQV